MFDKNSVLLKLRLQQW